MLLDLPTLVAKHNLKITGVLHCGAHLAEEAALYHGLGISNVTWVEANPAVIPKILQALHRWPGQRLVHALVYSEPDVEMTLNVTNYDGMSSSIFEFGTHPQFSPDTVFVDKVTMRTETIDAIADTYGVQANCLNMDLQGAELHALRGATNFLEGVDVIVTEVNSADVYVGCAKIHELDEYLVGFERVETHWVPGQGWGDAAYTRTVT